MPNSSTVARSTENPYTPLSAEDPVVDYRTLNRSAVASVILALLATLGLIFPILLVLALAGLMLGYSGYRAILRYPEEYSGLTTARLGMLACTLLFVGGSAWHTYDYVTEVPEGYKRVLFSELQPDGFKEKGLPKRAFELSGEKIFIKGYMHPGVANLGKTKQFVLVPDMGTCCFGGQPKPTDMILVNTDEDSKLAYSRRTVKLGGEFKIGDRLESFGDLNNVLYRIDANYSK